MNRPVFPRIPEARRRAQERASLRSRAPVESPASVPKPTVAPESRLDPTQPVQRGKGIADTPLEPGTPDSGVAP